MPIVRIEMLEGRSSAAKSDLIRRVTRAVVEATGVKPEQVRIVLHEVPPTNWAVGGESMAERQANTQPTEERP